MQIGKFLFQLDVEMIGARNVPRSPGAGAALVDRAFHGVQNCWFWPMPR